MEQIEVSRYDTMALEHFGSGRIIGVVVPNSVPLKKSSDIASL